MNIDSNIKFKKLLQKFPYFESISASKAHFYQLIGFNFYEL
jgi:hypothetical protein